MNYSLFLASRTFIKALFPTTDPYAQRHSKGSFTFLCTLQTTASGLVSSALISCDAPFPEFGPFQPQIRVRVPIWLAMLLKRQGKCTVVSPEWFTTRALRTVLELERAEELFQVFFKTFPTECSPDVSSRTFHSTTSNYQLICASTLEMIW